MRNNAEKASLYIIVRGRVQGVGFRAFTAQQAGEMGVAGWVRNVGYDQVEVRAEGRRADLEILLEKVRRGPVPARVEAEEVKWGEFRGEFKNFRVRWF
jgi:acylphosphatase